MRWLPRNELRTDDLGEHLDGAARVGVPYTEAMIDNAAADALGQASPDSAAGGADRALRRGHHGRAPSTARPAR